MNDWCMAYEKVIKFDLNYDYFMCMVDCVNNV